MMVRFAVQMLPLRLVAALHFGGNDQSFLVADFDRERYTTTRPHCRSAPFHSQFDVVGIKIAAIDDDQILQPAGDKKLAVSQESQIPCAEKWPVTGICEIGVEGESRFLGPVPIALGHVRCGYPDFSYLIRSTSGQ